MEEMELKSIWNAYDKKLERSLKLNLKLLEDMQKSKAESKLKALLSVKAGGIIVGALWNLFLGVLLYGNHFRNIYFSISIGVLMLFGIIAIATYIKHIVLISRVDYTGNITDTQRHLAELQVSTVNVTGFLWLQLPFYTTFFWNQGWISSGGSSFWLIAVPITLIFTALAVWLYKNINHDNLHKAWVKKFMVIGVEYKYVLSASELLQEIEDFKGDEI